MKAHVQEELCELLRGRGSRTHVGTISAHHEPQESIRIDTPRVILKEHWFELYRKCHHLPLYIVNLFISLSVHQIHPFVRPSVHPSS